MRMGLRARLLQPIRFVYQSGCYATIGEGESGVVEEITDDGVLVQFSHDCIVPEKGLPTEPFFVRVKLDMVKLIEDFELAAKEYTLPNAKLCAPDFFGHVWLCETCKRMFLSPAAEGGWNCPVDDTSLIHTYRLRPWTNNDLRARALRCSSCQRLYAKPFDTFLCEFVCPDDKSVLIEPSSNLTKGTPESVLTARSGQQYMLEPPHFDQGFSAFIYRAVNLNSGAEAACKLLMHEFQLDLFWLESMVGEIEFLRKLNHPNIVKYVDSGVSGNVPFLIMERVDGANLWDIVVQRGRVRPYDALFIAARICQALGHLDQLRLWHPDLKASDVLVSDDRSQVKLIDFNKPFLHHKTRKLPEIRDRGSFTCPDLMKGGATISSNVYSLGCIIYFMLSGESPFKGKNMAEVATQHLMANRPKISTLCSDCPRDLENLLVSMMNVQFWKRPNLWEVDQALSRITRQL